MFNPFDKLAGFLGRLRRSQRSVENHFRPIIPSPMRPASRKRTTRYKGLGDACIVNVDDPRLMTGRLFVMANGQLGWVHHPHPTREILL
jgi:hypothetical protein